MSVRTLYFVILFSPISSAALAQELYNKGYYSDRQQNTLHGYISLNSVTDDTSYFLFKKEYKAMPDTIPYADITELRVSDFKFLRKNSLILAPGYEPNEYSLIESDELLRVELEGEASLFSKRSEDDITFYFSVEDELTTELIYSQYQRFDGNVARDNEFREQLESKLTCGNIDFASLKYDKSQLINVFSDYNQCMDADHQTYSGIPFFSPDFLNLGVTLGASSYFIESSNTVNGTELLRFTGSTPVFEADIEYLLPGQNNRISFFFTAGYLSFKDQDEKIILGTRQRAYLSYQVIQTTLGVRVYQPVNNFLKFYGELGLGKDYETGNGIYIDYELDNLGYQDFNSIRLTGHLSGGIGMILFNRYMIQAKVNHLNTQISDTYSDQEVNQAILMLGFKVLLKSYYK